MGDTARITIGATVLGLGLAAVAAGPLTQKRVQARSAGDNASLIALAAEQGVDLSGGTPGVKRDRLLGAVEAGTARDWAQLGFANGVVTDAEGALFTGYFVQRFEDGSPRMMGSVVNGRLEGTCVLMHPGGAIRAAWSYAGGELAGQFIEYHPGGEMLVRAIAGGRTPSGGTEMVDILVDRRTDAGEIERQDVGAGRLQFIDDRGTTTLTNEERDPTRYEGFMLFEYGWYGRESVVTSDSRSLTGSPESDGAGNSTESGEPTDG